MDKRARFQFYFRLLLFLSLGVLLVSCGQPSPTPKVPAHTSDPVETWIRQHAIPFKTSEPGGSDDDLQPLQQIVGNATIVGLGEATHGTHEFFTMKHRILEFLVNKMGFNTFAIENGWDVSRSMDTYVNTGKGNARDILRQDFDRMWQTQEVLDMIEWMRAYNADSSHTTKVHFAGFDCTVITPAAFDDVLNYLQSVDPQQTAQVQTLYTGIRPSRAIAYLRGYTTSQQKHYQDNAQRVYDLLKAHQAVYESHSSKEAFALALQSAQVILQYTSLAALLAPSETVVTQSRPAYIKRDTFMAENVAWLHDHEGSTAKIVLWAHNLHIANIPDYFGSQEKNMGAFLRDWYQENYLSIGTSFYQGTFRNFSTSESYIDTLQAPSTDSYNYTLGSVGIPQYILDIRKTPSGPVTNWVQGPRILRTVGLRGSHGADLDQVMFGSLQERFDVIIHFQNITASQLLRY